MMQRYTIRAKLLFCLILFAAAFAFVIGTLGVSVRTNTSRFDTLLVDRIQPMEQLKVIADAYAVSIVDATHKARSGVFTLDEARGQIVDGRDRIAKSWKAYRATYIADHEAVLANEAEVRMRKADSAVDALLQILERRDHAALDRFAAKRLYPAIDPVSETMSALVEEQIKIALKVTSDASALNRWFLTASVAIAVVIAGVWLFALQIARNNIITPISTLAETMEGIAEAQDIQIPYRDNLDEIGRMARACEIFRLAAEARARTEEEQAVAQAQVTDALRTAIAAMSAGRLTHRIDVCFPTEYESVRDDFNAALASLRDLIGTVSESAAAIRTGSGEIAHASEDLARRTETNASSLEQTAASVAQMDDRLKATAQAATLTAQRAGETTATVSNGRAIADDAVRAMMRVSETAKGIDGVIEGLDKIAFQTRVLAMNAAVEAGRAGEAGRGFAVVADLVSALAMRAEEEAGRARDQLTTTQTEIVAAVEMVERVDGALAGIADDVDEVHSLLAQMAGDNQAQSNAVSEIAVAIGAMDRATQQNAAMVEETSAATRNLTSEVATLIEETAKFDIGGARAIGPEALSLKPNLAAALPFPAARNAMRPGAALLASG